jgi:hypothetical protein
MPSSFSRASISRALTVLPLPLVLTACVGTTGGETFEFDAYAQGPSAADGSSYTFEEKANGYDVTLTRANIHIGAVYLNRAVATSVASNTSCTLQGIYDAEVVPSDGGIVLDALSPELQPFPNQGHATSDRNFTGEVWLNGGDVNDPSDTTVILDVAGTAEKDGVQYPFVGELTIGANHADSGSTVLPGLHPICKQRIVSPIGLDITPASGGTLVLRVDPARMFANVDFSDLVQEPDGLFHFDDERESESHVVDNASKSLYTGLHATTAYDLIWNHPQ